MSNSILTVGHSNHDRSTLIDLLKMHQVRLLIDVRAFPWSARHPQFSKAQLARTLQAARIEYRWEGKRLGGFRKAVPDSVHHALGAGAFRGYADHMASREFVEIVGELVLVGGDTRLVIMCAEANYQQCHRQFISDAFVQRGVEVTHIAPDGGIIRHCLSDSARVVDEELVYDLNSQQRLDF